MGRLRREDVAALKRLQREAFESLSEVSDRTFGLEKREQLRGGSSSGWVVGSDLDPAAAAHVALAGAVEAAPAVLLSQVHLQFEVMTPCCLCLRSEVVT